MRKLIDVDLSNIWGNIEFHSLIQMEKRLTEASIALKEAQSLHPNAMDYLLREPDAVAAAVSDAVSRMLLNSSALIVIGPPAVLQYIKAAVRYQNNTGMSGISLFFIGDSLSPDAMKQVAAAVQKTDFSVLLVERITTIEEAIALRQMKWLLNRKYGPEKALDRIYAVVSTETLQVSPLSENLESEQIYALGSQLPGFPFAACMVPIAAAGKEPAILADGLRRAAADLERTDLDNPVWLYVAARYLLTEHGAKIEEFHIADPELLPFGHWCCQLFSETEPVCKHRIQAVLNPYTGYTYRAHTFETAVELEEKTGDSEIELDLRNEDGLNYLSGRHLSEIEAFVSSELSRIKAEQHFPSIIIKTQKHSLRQFGYLTYFFWYAANLSAQMLQKEAEPQYSDAVLKQKILDSLFQKYKI